MRLTTVILIATIMQVSASGFAQKISLVQKNAPLNSVLKEIRKQSGYNFIITGNLFKQSRLVSIEVNQVELSDVLALIFKEQSLTYTIENKTVVIKQSERSFFENVIARLQEIDIKGKVVDSAGVPLSGATVKIKGTNRITRTDINGEFVLDNVEDNGILVISYLGYESREIGAAKNILFIKLAVATGKLEEVNVTINTGYQILSKERATGSFVHIDSTLINRSVSTSLIDRLNGVTSGLIFNKPSPGINLPALSIRGRSTLFANADPLIVLDNFPYEGNINNINPNDVASITVLKDAAAASIWGVKAGNGVIVITTKKGRKSAAPQITFNASNMLTAKPDLHYQQWMSNADYLGMEQFLFNKGYYEDNINNGYSAISPAVAIMLQRRNSQISSSDSLTAINQLKGYDIRKQMEQYLFRPSHNQQFALSVNGGGQNSSYYLSAGYNKDQQSLTTNNSDRLTLNLGNQFSFLNNKLQVTTGLLLTLSNQKSSNNTYSIPFTPYDNLIDEQGNPLAIVSETGLRKQYTDTAGKGLLLDWNYRPLEENYPNTKNNQTDYLIKTGAKYAIFSGLDLSLSYQYQKGNGLNNTLYSPEAFYTRNQINSFSVIDAGGNLSRPVPTGSINSDQHNSYYSHYLRTQLSYSRLFSENHRVDLLGGAEWKNARGEATASTRYGFNPSTYSHIPVDYLTNYIQYFNGWTANIPEGASQSYTIDRFRSIFFNGAYTLFDRYTLSASTRKDESNLFGVDANQKGVPLWSAGLMWNLSKEKFYHWALIPNLKLRATYGYNGNLDRSTSAYLTARNLGVNNWNAPYSSVINPPNPSLRWERVENMNFGFDFSSKGNLISGSIDYFIKKGNDLIGNSPLAPQTGVIQFRGNSANTRTSGMDLVIQKNTISDAAFQWQSHFLLSYNKEIVTQYKVKQGTNLSIVNANYNNPLEGYPYYSLFGFKSAGLDENGNPQGFHSDEISKDYPAINNSTVLSQLEYIGSASPLVYGSLRNTFRYRNLELSLNLTYKLGYYFRRTNVFSGSRYTYNTAGYPDRWQQPGDETKTIIPAMRYPLNSSADAFFRATSQLAEKGDHLRFQDIRLSYQFSSAGITKLFKNLQVYAYANNLGLLWKATDKALDPDDSASSYIQPKSISLGLSANF
ncbi:MAG: SusC/RagA family TonB-linked outer membrane protein [Bacteroidota bacterium]